MTVAIRELSKNLAVWLPHSPLLDLCNYAVGNAPALRRNPDTVLSGVDKSEYFAKVWKRLSHDGPVLFLEFGVWQGNSLRVWAELSSHEESRFFGFDSFEGIPQAWRRRPAGYFSTAGNPPEARDERVRFVKGWFNET